MPLFSLPRALSFKQPGTLGGGQQTQAFAQRRGALARQKENVLLAVAASAGWIDSGFEHASVAVAQRAVAMHPVAQTLGRSDIVREDEAEVLEKAVQAFLVGNQAVGEAVRQIDQVRQTVVQRDDDLATRQAQTRLLRLETQLDMDRDAARGARARLQDAQRQIEHLGWGRAALARLWAHEDFQSGGPKAFVGQVVLSLVGAEGPVLAYQHALRRWRPLEMARRHTKRSVQEARTALELAIDQHPAVQGAQAALTQRQRQVATLNEARVHAERALRTRERTLRDQARELVQLPALLNLVQEAADLAPALRQQLLADLHRRLPALQVLPPKATACQRVWFHALAAHAGALPRLSSSEAQWLAECERKARALHQQRIEAAQAAVQVSAGPQVKTYSFS